MKKISFFLMLFAFALLMSQPATNAPVPTKSASNVVSVYSDSYTSIANNFNPGWGQSGTVNPTFEAVAGSGNNVLHYANFNYQGTELTAQNLSTMDYLHVDIWVPAGNTRQVKISPINSGGTGETLVAIPVTPGSWNSVDLPKSNFTGMTWNNVIQMKFDGQFNSDGTANTSGWDIYLDNIYFWKVASTQDASLSALRIDGQLISGFSAGTLAYTYNVQPGTTTVPTVSATATQASSTVLVNAASSIPGQTSVVVTAQDGVTTRTYTVQFVAIAFPLTAAPTPPARPTDDVISIFSDVYTDIASSRNTFGTATIEDVTISGNNTAKLSFTAPGSGFQYITPSLDLSTFTNMHLDFWVTGEVEPGQVVQIIVQNFNADNSFEGNLIYNVELQTAGSQNWYSADIPFSSFTPNSRNNIKQIQIVGAGPVAYGPTYFDNIYFHKSTLSLSDVNKSKNALVVYPNPVSSGEIVNINKRIKNAEIYNTAGQKVKSVTSQTVSSQGLAKGLYILKVTDEKGETQSTKLIVK